MRCDDIQALLAVRQELSWAQEREIQEHVRGCPHCATTARQIRNAHRVLLSLPQPTAPLPPQRVAIIRDALLRRPTRRG
jgi:predicted anti-sigma-YlaC factor YlaD